jgi:hypothetical protein
MSSDDDLVTTAIKYPYFIPSGSFIFDVMSASVREVPTISLDERHGRVAVLAVGSNASPVQLARKFHNAASGTIPAQRVVLRDHDAVYAARVSAYGAVPATLVRCEGTLVSLHITYLDDAQKSALDHSESVPHAYRLGQIEPSYFDSESGIDTVVDFYEAQSGPLLLDNEPVALAAINALNRRYMALDEAGVLSVLAARSGLSLREFVLQMIRNTDLRAEFNATLAAEGLQ